MNLERIGIRAVLGIVVVGMFVNLAWCCNIPVFRYALENWQPDAYQVLVLSRGPLSADQQGTVDRLEAAAVDADRPANLQIHSIDVEQDGLANELKERLRPHTPADWALTQLVGWIEAQSLDQAQMVVFYPRTWDRIAWQSNLSEDNVARLIDSPLRQEIAKRLLDGQSAVWVLVESGNPEQDVQAWATLQAGLQHSQTVVQLPARDLIETDEFFRPEVEIELRVEFTALRLSKDDAAETAFRALLRGSEADLGEFDAPLAIPIYGRGRTYFALVGPGINEGMIEESGRFLCGACSCQVKEDNPGIDMLMAVNWQDNIQGSAMPEVVLPDLTGIGGLELASQPEDVNQPSSEDNNLQDPTMPVTARTTNTDEATADEALDPPGNASPTVASATQRQAEAASRASTTPDGFSWKLILGIVGGTVVAVLVLALATFFMPRS